MSKDRPGRRTTFERQAGAFGGRPMGGEAAQPVEIGDRADRRHHQRVGAGAGPVAGNRQPVALMGNIDQRPQIVGDQEGQVATDRQHTGRAALPHDLRRLGQRDVKAIRRCLQQGLEAPSTARPPSSSSDRLTTRTRSRPTTAAVTSSV